MITFDDGDHVCCVIVTSKACGHYLRIAAALPLRDQRAEPQRCATSMHMPIYITQCLMLQTRVRAHDDITS